MTGNRTVLGVALVASVVWCGPVWAQTIQNGQVEIHGALPRTAGGAVDVEALKQTIQTQFARLGVEEIQFRNVTLTEAEQRALFLNGDQNRNLLRQVSTVVPSVNGSERTVTFRSNDFRARVGREEGQLRARVEGVDHSQLTEAERNGLRAQFDRFRLDGAGDRGGSGNDNRGGRGDNSGPGSANSGPGREGDGGGRGGRDDVRVAQAGDVRQEDRQQDRRQDRQADRQQDRREDRREDRRDNRRDDRRSNAGGEVRGLDRADQVAGEQGQQGRDNVRSAQIDRPNRVERVDRPQRPERPERPQRPERPERPERAGRN